MTPAEIIALINVLIPILEKIIDLMAEMHKTANDLLITQQSSNQQNLNPQLLPEQVKSNV
jgi:hypothetical protein